MHRLYRVQIVRTITETATVNMVAENEVQARNFVRLLNIPPDDDNLEWRHSHFGDSITVVGADRAPYSVAGEEVPEEPEIVTDEQPSNITTVLFNAVQGDDPAKLLEARRALREYVFGKRNQSRVKAGIRAHLTRFSRRMGVTLDADRIKDLFN